MFRACPGGYPTWMSASFDVAVVDVDGTLVDTNYHHALAWFRAFRRHDITVPVWRLHRAIGMGGDQLVSAVAGDDVEDRLGDDLRAAWAEEFAPMLDEIRPLDGAPELLRGLREHGLSVVLASSGKPEHVDAYLKLFDGHELADEWTSSEDVERTKPQPDLITVAVERGRGTTALVIGDSVWDFRAAAKAGHTGYAVRTGGFSAEELRESGAREVFTSLPELREALDRILREA
jgi:HAD superfamily hydrolase (TIGR01549 family)